MIELVLFMAKGDWGWVQFLVPIVAMIIYVVNQLLSGAGKTGKKTLPQQQRPRNRQPPGRQDVNDEVRDFLQRASERKSETRPPAQQQEASRPTRRLQQQSIEIVDAEVIDDPPTGAGVRSHVKQHLNTREFDQRASQMAQGEANSDRVMQSHMHKTFDHQLGSLAPAATSDPPMTQEEQQASDLVGVPNTANDFMAMLRNPAQVRQAIIMNEILRRPEDRW
jgi:hypothetical protein